MFWFKDGKEKPFLSKIQNLTSEKTGKKILLLSCKNSVKTQFLGVVIHYLKNKVGVVDFANAQGMVMFQSPRAHSKKIVNYGSFSKIGRKNHYLEFLKSKIQRKNHYSQKLCFDRIFEIKNWKEKPLLPKIVFWQNFCMKEVQFSFWFSH